MSANNTCCSSGTVQQPFGSITTRCAPGWHRRPLPGVAVSLNSDEGKLLFRQALLTDGLHGYFSLAGAFHTQAEPFYCGPGTLSMGKLSARSTTASFVIHVVLNSLNIDPGLVWKGNWRFFDEHILRTCDKRKPKDEPLRNIMEKGITFEEFLYLAECNGASVVPFLASNTTLAQFRSAILVACTRRLDDLRLVCSYNRRTLQQSGTGHFSPIAGYHAEKQLVLIMDVARFKYPPHWIPVEMLWESMCTIDPSTEKSRGFYLFSKWPSDVSIQCGTETCQSTTEPASSVSRLLCAADESLSPFIDCHLRSSVTDSVSIESTIRSILRTLTPAVIPLTTKWTFDLVQKYRLRAVMNSQRSNECQCVNQFDAYRTFLPASTSAVSVEDSVECKKPCARVTRTHIHAYATPTRCALDALVHLFLLERNRTLYALFERLAIETYLNIGQNQQWYLFGGLSSLIDRDEMIPRVERALLTIFFYALRSDTFLAADDVFDSNDVSAELKEEIDYARACFGLL